MDCCNFFGIEFKVTGQLIGLALVGVTTHKNLVMFISQNYDNFIDFLQSETTAHERLIGLVELEALSSSTHLTPKWNRSIVSYPRKSHF